MKLSITGVAVTALLLDYSNAQIWMVDPLSCDVESGKYDFVQTSMRNALAMATAANDALQQTPMSSAAQNALDLLVNTMNPTDGVYFGNKVFGAEGITRLTTQVLSNDALGSNDVKLYYDQSRLQPRISNGITVYYDSDIRQALSDEDYDNCNIFSTFMYTTNPNQLVYNAQNKLPIFNQIQICSTFLTSALPAPNKWTVMLPIGFWLTKLGVSLVRALVTTVYYTQIDVYSLFDKVLLHELTHANRLYSTIDVYNGDGVCYGWQKCRALSTVQTLPESGDLVTGSPEGPELNADTWALFGSIAWQLSTGRITSVNDDGSLNVA